MIFNYFSQLTTFLVIFSSFCRADDTKYDVTIENLEIIKGSDILSVDIDVKKTGPIIFNITGTVEHSKQISDEWLMRIEIIKQDSSDGKGGFKTYYPNSAGKDICSFLQNEYKTHLYEGLKDYSDAPHYDTCPLEPTKYTFNEYPLDGTPLDRYLSAGDFEVKIQLSTTDFAEMDIEYLVTAKVVENE